MRPDASGSLPVGGGMNPTLCNAEIEGGPRNGVMTALDDFIAEHDRPLRLVVLPIYFGLGDRRRGGAARRASPSSRPTLDRLESADGKDELLEPRGRRSASTR